MIRTFYPGGWYADSLPDGEQCILIPGSHIETHLGRVSIPPDTGLGIIFLRCTNVEGFRFAGPSHQQTTPTYTRTWEYDGGDWGIAREQSYICNSPVIYDHEGALLIADPSVGSNGYRYCDVNGVVWTGDQTYGPWHSLSEWSDIGDGLYIGQSHPDWARDAAWVYDTHSGRHHALEPGRCTFIRAHADGDRFALTLVKPEPNPERPEENVPGTVIYRGTFAELRALPVVDPAGPSVPPEPGPGPDPGPEPPDPPEPGPEPPEPTPPSPYARHKEHPVMETQIVAIKGPGGKYGRPDAPNTGPWGHLGTGWRAVRFDRATPDADCRFELSKPDDKHKLVNVSTRGLFSVDPTAAHIEEQFNIKPSETDRGWSESPVVYDGNLFGQLTGQVEFTQDAALGRFVSCAFVVVPL